MNQLYFGVLLIREQLLQNVLFKRDIQNGIDKAKARLANGTPGAVLMNCQRNYWRLNNQQLNYKPQEKPMLLC
jgi:hypothetical protein